MNILAQIRLHTKTAAQWISSNPILKLGQKGIETDTGLEKTGNGTDNWNSLDYLKVRIQDIINYATIELNTNKSTSVTTDKTSNTKYPSVKSVYDYVKVFADKITAISSGNFLGTYVSLAELKADYPNPNPDLSTVAGNTADVDTGSGSPAVLYIYDAQEGWVVPAGSSGVTLSYLTTALANYVKSSALSSILLNYAPKVQPYETGGFYLGKPPVSTVVYAKPFSIPVTFPANLAGSLVYCEGAAATANTIFNLKKNNTSVGSITITAGSRTATFSLPGGVSFAAGDRLTVVSPAAQDETLEGLSFSLIGER